MYSQLANDWDAAVRGGALMRLARVRRRINNPQAAVRAYDELSEITGVSVSGLPAGLVARVGRASVYEEMGRTPELRSEAESLDRDLRAGRWQLTIQEYESYSGLTKTWLRGTLQAPEPDSLTRTDAAAWLWENRRNLVSRQWINVSGKALLIVPRATSDGFVAAIAETDYLTSLCREQIGTDPVQCTFSDAEGRILAGPALQTGMETRTAASTRLPWTLHLSGDSGYPAAASRKPGLLGMVFVLTLVWLAGAAFIVHGIGREVRMARLQSDFVAAVSHEFRSPLTSIGQIAEMLSSDRLSSQESRSQAYTVLSRESDRLRRLVEGLLDFQKIESDSPIYHFELVEIGPFLKTVVSDFRQRVADRGYTVELGETHGAPVVRADRDALSLATWNLLDNAMKYSPDCKTVWVDVEHSGKTVIVVVRDRGLGIPLKEQRAIFERFVRGADAKARRIRGTGIGLALVRRIVQAHGGEIRLWSQPGEGSRFAMIFPAGVES
jgi:signal transduction histidine kinase